MITIRPKRSAKCSGRIRQPSTPKKYGPPKSSRIASAQSEPWSTSSVAAAAAIRPTPTAVLIPSAITDRRSCGSSLLASANSAMWAMRTTA
jgi:hypothetical protein